MGSRRILPSFFAALTLAALLATTLARPAGATTYVPVSDEALVDQAALIVLGRIAERRPAAGGPPRPSTSSRSSGRSAAARSPRWSCAYRVDSGPAAGD